MYSVFLLTLMIYRFELVNSLLNHPDLLHKFLFQTKFNLLIFRIKKVFVHGEPEVLIKSPVSHGKPEVLIKNGVSHGKPEVLI